MPYVGLKTDEQMPTKCECCEPARRLERARTGPLEHDIQFYCPTTAASFKRIVANDGRSVILRGVKMR